MSCVNVTVPLGLGAVFAALFCAIVTDRPTIRIATARPVVVSSASSQAKEREFDRKFISKFGVDDFKRVSLATIL